MVGIVDLFCGCGGLSLGAHLAGFQTQVAIDIDSTLSSAYSQNFPRSKLINGDLMEISPKYIRSVIGKERPLGLVGGPPCQGFSIMGHRRSEDPRNSLLTRYFYFVKKLEPSFFLMENVPGLLSGTGKALLESAINDVSKHYEVLPPMVLNAADFGAATNRPRAIVIGFRRGDFSSIPSVEFFASGVKSPRTVKDAIKDLPEPSENSEWLKYRRVKEVSDYATKLRRHPRNGFGDETAVEMLKIFRVNGLQATKHTDKVVKRFEKLREGERDAISKYPRLSWDKPSVVLRAGTGSEKGSFQAARPIHPSKPRVITVREASRIQGFPDWYQFHNTVWHSHRMIGNSVSPIFAYEIFKRIKRLV